MNHLWVLLLLVVPARAETDWAGLETAAGLALECAHQEYPNKLSHVLNGDGDAKPPFSWLITLARPFFRSPEKGAQTSIYRASDPEVEGVTGKYFADSKETEPTAIAQDDEAASRLWTASEELIARF